MTISNAIADHESAPDLFASGDLAGTLAAINERHWQVKQSLDGFASVATFGSTLGQELLAKFLMTLRTVVASLYQGNQMEQAQATIIDVFLDRFIVGNPGVDFANDDVRATLESILPLGGFTQEEIDQVLSLGYTLESCAEKHMGRQATMDDLTGLVTQQLSEVLETEFRSGQNDGINQAIAAGDRAGLVTALRALADAIEGV